MLIKMALGTVPWAKNDEGVKNVFMQMCNENYRKEWKENRSFNTWTILSKENIIAHFS